MKQAIFPLFLEAIDHVVEVAVGQAVAVIGQENLFVPHLIPHGQ